jgi:ABC-2 type transport system permease protein
MCTVKVYLSIISKSFLCEYIYRANVVFTVLRNILMIFILVSVWRSLYESRVTVNSISLEDMIAYTLAVISLKNLTSARFPLLIHEKIRNGSIVTDFIRPVSFMIASISDQIGKNLFSFMFATVPVVTVSLLFFDIGHFDAVRSLLFGASAFMGMVLVFQISWVLSLLTFWTNSAAFGNFLIRGLIEIFGGTTIPLWFYPEAMRTLCMILPFRLAYFSPATIILGKVSFIESVHIILFQALWIVVMIGVERLVWINARKAVTVQGG